jgi:RNA polymerase sigma-70 factor (ECF subfamily)
MDELTKLIEAAQGGDVQSYGQIYQHFYKRIFRFCRGFLPDNDSAADVCQDTFVKAWLALPNFSLKNGGSFQAFLFRIARNLLIDRSRKKKEGRLEQAEEIEEIQDFEDSVDKDADRQKLNQALAKLDENDRQLVILRYFEELSFSEVAHITGMKEGALRVKTHRALKKLKELLKDNLSS